LTGLVKKIDAATAKNRDAGLGSFAVFCSDEEGLERKLQALAEKEKLADIVIAIDNPSGPPRYKIARDAEVTVILYTKGMVKANYAFKKGKLKDKDIDAIVGDLSRILPASK
jgi:hypothetical protein